MTSLPVRAPRRSALPARAARLCAFAALVSLPSVAARADFRVGPELDVPSRSLAPGVASAADGRVLIVWKERDVGIRGSLFDADGIPLGTENFPVSESTSINTSGPQPIFADDGEFVVVWRDYGSSMEARRFDASGAPLGVQHEVTRINCGNGSGPVPDGAGGFWIGAYWGNCIPPFSPRDARLQRMAADASPVGDPIEIDAEGYYPNVIRLADGTLVALWFTASPVATGRRLDPDGATIGADFVVPGRIGAATPDGGFLVTWAEAEETRGGEPADVLAARYAANGTPVGAPFVVNGYTTGRQADPAVAVTDEEDLIFAWTSEPDQDGDGDGVFARRFTSIGDPLGGEFQVNRDTQDNQQVPEVASVPGIGFVITWATPGNIGSMQRFTTADTVTVTKPDDTDDGACDPFDCSLREAVDASIGDGTVVLPAGGYAIAGAPVVVDSDLGIAGAGAKATVLDAGGSSRAFEIEPGVEARVADLTVQNGAAESGAAFSNAGSLLLERVTLRGHVATGAGGAVDSSGALVVRDSTLSGNWAASGGALRLAGTSADVENSTLSGNVAAATGSAALIEQPGVTFTHVTVKDNTRADGSEAIEVASGDLSFANSAIEGDCSGGGGVASSGGNVAAPGSACGLDDESDQPGLDAVALGLVPLHDNGGPTATHAPGVGSLAIDAALPGACLATDQRGRPRVAPECDAGAVEVQPGEALTPVFADGFELGNTSAWSEIVG